MLSHEEIVDYVTGIIEECLKEDLPKIQDEFDKHKNEIEHSFSEAVDELCQQIILNQDLGKKEEIHVMQICYLQTPILSGDYHVRIFMYNQMYYLERKENSITWKVPFIYNYFEKEYNFIFDKVKKNVVHVNYTDLYFIKVSLYEMYQDLLYEMLTELIHSISQLDSFQKMKKSAKFCVSFSKYMMPGRTLDFKLESV